MLLSSFLGPAESFSSASSSCLTDLMFVIDTSTSVEAEFQQQLQLAVDLVSLRTMVKENH